MTAGEEAQDEPAAAAAPAAPGRRLQRTTTMLAYRKVRWRLCAWMFCFQEEKCSQLCQ